MPPHPCSCCCPIALRSTLPYPTLSPNTSTPPCPSHHLPLSPNTACHVPRPGSAQGLPLHEAVAHLAEAWLPFLADEAAWAAHALRMHK